MSSLRIAIIGGGPGGLTLANILQNNGISFTVFERDASSNERDQGGTLDLDFEAGQAALREARLWDQFTEHARPESDALKLVTLDGEVLFDENTEPIKSMDDQDARPEIDRGKLQKILFEGLHDGSIKFGKILTEVAAGSRRNTWDLCFRDGSVEKDFDLVVGADGAWSRVRQFLTKIEPFYSGISAAELWALDIEQQHEWMIDYVGRGTLFSSGEGRAIIIQRNGDGNVRTYACLRKPESFIEDCGIDWSSPDSARQQLVDTYYSDCGEQLKRMILESSEQLIPRKLYMLPVGTQWEPKSGVTLLGDAAHLMTPFAGNGVNAAMLDALELARSLISVKEGKSTSLDQAIQSYENQMYSVSREFAEETMRNLNNNFTESGVLLLAQQLSGRMDIFGK